MDNVLLIHGLAAPKWTLRRLASEVRSNGFAPTTWGYPILWRSIEQHAENLRQMLQKIDADDSSLHVVAHSMGGIILRSAISDLKLNRPGRLVMLGVPNSGSYAASKLSKPFRRFCPALDDICTEPDAYVHQLDEPTQFEVGTIAAERDIVVSEESTRLRCERDHMSIDCRHGTLPMNRRSIAQIVHFLKEGSFSHTDERPAEQSVEGAG